MLVILLLVLLRYIIAYNFYAYYSEITDLVDNSIKHRKV
jgi:hypothetical protein